MQSLKLIPLGTSSGVPTRDRNVSALALCYEGGHDSGWMLLDCGEGTQYRVIHASLSLHWLKRVCITHLHGDHLFGLPGVLGTLGLQGRKEPLQIFGPPGIRAFLETVRGVSQLHLSYEIQVEEVDGEWSRQLDEMKLSSLPLDHRVQAQGYRIEFQSGLSITYCTDTRPCENAVKLARNTSLLIHEATYLHELQEKASERGHSTAVEAAETARQAGAERLLLTHFSPRYRSPEPLVAEARGIFPETEAAIDLKPVFIESRRTRSQAA